MAAEFAACMIEGMEKMPRACIPFVAAYMLIHALNEGAGESTENLKRIIALTTDKYEAFCKFKEDNLH